MKRIRISILLAVIIFMLPFALRAQLSNLHGDERYSYNGLHSGNQIRVTFYNDGMCGVRYVNPEDIRGEWPINSGHGYINQLIMFVGSEVKDTEGQIKHIISEGNGCTTGNSNNADSGDSGPNGEWWSMAPLPGFANDTEKRIAMSHWTWSWPPYWPDKLDDTVDPGWSGSWNGYFGKNVLNADQESYYVMDDYNNREWSFYPDSTNTERRGLGLRGTVRGFQWSNVLVEDVLFFLYDIKNIGTTHHDKMNFGIMSGPIMGALVNSAGDGSDDGGAYSLEEEIGWHYDQDDIGTGGWPGVGLHGLAFYETPGNPFDGIDNDGDGGNNGNGDIITTAMFDAVRYNVGDTVIIIDYTTFERTKIAMPATGAKITYLKKEYTFMPNQDLVEIEHNLIDDNLNGIIDENNGSTFGEGADAVVRFLNLDLKYVNYFTGSGINNLLIDEKRDDGIDNDEDWDPGFDDVGLDGVPNTGDVGEGDGLPTSGVGTELPGEPSIDKTDISESDMIGLTAFNIYTPWTLYPLSDDENLWEGILPGFLNALGQFGDTDIMLGSGFFPMKPDQIERFSLGVHFALTQDELFRNKSYAEKTYSENYNFAKAPYIPTLTAIPGDHKVTLLWDDFAEKSKDPITGEDFEGYRIYRSTDPGFNEMLRITDGYGSNSYKKPMVQFDLANGIAGFAAVHVEGVEFYLGDDTGLVHSWTDTTTVNGQKYYYAITSYDHGDDALGIAPTECSKYISISTDGTVDKGINVAIVRPEAPSAGFVPARFDSSKIGRLHGTIASGDIDYQILNPYEIRENNTYQITFEDTLTGPASAQYPSTKCFHLVNITTGDTLIKASTAYDGESYLPITDGFLLKFRGNPAQMNMNADSSRALRGGVYSPRLLPFRLKGIETQLQPGDFRIEFGELGIDSSVGFQRGTDFLPPIPVNFTITNTILNKKMKFAFRQRDGEDGLFTAYSVKSASDEVIVLSDSLVPGWQITLVRSAEDTLCPEAGDVLLGILNKPFMKHDVFQFTTFVPTINQEQVALDMENIRVVPNPYVVSNSWEPFNPYTDGRGPRELHFTHLPPKCTIKIFNVRGQLVVKLDHNTPSLADGTEIWDMLTKDKLDIAYGVYVYLVEAEGLGTKTGKFAVIK